MSSYRARILNTLTGLFIYLVAIHYVHIVASDKQDNKLDQITKTQQSIQLDLDALDTQQWMILNRLDSMATNTLSNE